MSEQLDLTDKSLMDKHRYYCKGCGKSSDKKDMIYQKIVLGEDAVFTNTACPNCNIWDGWLK